MISGNGDIISITNLLMHKRVTNKEFFEIKGRHIITLCDIRKGNAADLQEEINLNIQKRSLLVRAGEATRDVLHRLWCEYRLLIEQLHRFKTQESIVENITTTVGRSVLAQRLGNDTTYTGIVNYTALGDDNTAEVVGDATLGNETSRKALSSGTDAANIAYIETFFTAAEAVDTHEEYGMYIDGGAGADTGQLFNRFTETKVKSGVETMNVQSIITINDA